MLHDRDVGADKRCRVLEARGFEGSNRVLKRGAVLVVGE